MELNNLVVVKPPNIPDVSQPVLQRAAVVHVSQSSPDTSAVVMPANHDVRNLQKLDGILQQEVNGEPELLLPT